MFIYIYVNIIKMIDYLKFYWLIYKDDNFLIYVNKVVVLFIYRKNV